MTDLTSSWPTLPRGDLVTGDAGLTLDAGDLPPSATGQAALDAAAALGRKAPAPATLRATKADWTHYAAWSASEKYVRFWRGSSP